MAAPVRTSSTQSRMTELEHARVAGADGRHQREVADGFAATVGIRSMLNIALTATLSESAMQVCKCATGDEKRRMRLKWTMPPSKVSHGAQPLQPDANAAYLTHYAKPEKSHKQTWQNVVTHQAEFIDRALHAENQPESSRASSFQSTRDNPLPFRAILVFRCHPGDDRPAREHDCPPALMLQVEAGLCKSDLSHAALCRELKQRVSDLLTQLRCDIGFSILRPQGGQAWEVRLYCLHTPKFKKAIEEEVAALPVVDGPRTAHLWSQSLAHETAQRGARVRG